MARYVVKRPVSNIGRDNVCGYTVLPPDEIPPYGGFYVDGTFTPGGVALSLRDEAAALCEHLAKRGIKDWTFNREEGEAPVPAAVDEGIADLDEVGPRSAKHNALKLAARRLMKFGAPEIKLNASAQKLKDYLDANAKYLPEA